MAREVWQFNPSIPAGTAKATPVTIAMRLPVRIVRSVELEVPAGTLGLMGFYLAMSNVQVIPYVAGQWIVWDDKQKGWELDDYPTTGAWSLVGYNTGTHPHPITVIFHTDLIPHVEPPPTLESSARALGLVFPLALPTERRHSVTSGLGLGR